MNKGKKTNVKPFMVKNYLSVFITCMIENPAFDSQVRCPLLQIHVLKPHSACALLTFAAHRTTVAALPAPSCSVMLQLHALCTWSAISLKNVLHGCRRRRR